MIPGEIRVAEGVLELNAGRDRQSLVIVNDGDRPIQIGSHLHLPDANPFLTFDRESAQGFRLDVPAGTAVRFEPGVSRTVDLVALGGRRQVPGLQLRDRTPTRQLQEREPKPVVPFGTPGTQVETPARASTVRARVSDEPAEHDAEADAPLDQQPEDQQETP